MIEIIALLGIVLIASVAIGWRKIGEKGECPECRHCIEIVTERKHSNIHATDSNCSRVACPRNRQVGPPR